MKLGAKSNQKIERFFREYLADDDFRLPEIYFHGGRLTNLLTSALKIEGITIGRRIYIFPANFWRGENRKIRLDEELAVHEIAHVLQYRREGFFKFLWLYLKSYRTNLQKQKKWNAAAHSLAYFEIPFEIEARQIASEFVIWSRNRKNDAA